MHLVGLVESYKAVSRLILILADFAQAVLEGPFSIHSVHFIPKRRSSAQYCFKCSSGCSEVCFCSKADSFLWVCVILLQLVFLWIFSQLCRLCYLQARSLQCAPLQACFEEDLDALAGATCVFPATSEFTSFCWTKFVPLLHVTRKGCLVPRHQFCWGLSPDRMWAACSRLPFSRSGDCSIPCCFCSMLL